MEKNIFVIDVGMAWTKAFLFSLSTEIKILKSARCITTNPQIELGVNHLLTTLGQKEEEVVFLNGSERDKNLTALTNVFKKGAGKDFLVIDFGASVYKKTVEPRDISSHLKTPTQEVDIKNYLGNKRVRPWKIPHNALELEIEENFFLHANKVSLQQDSLGLIFTGALFTNKIGPYEILTLLNLIELPIADVYLDRENVSLSLGALINKEQMSQVSYLPGIERLGTIVSLNGADKVSFDFGQSEVQEVLVEEEGITLISAPKDKMAKISFTTKGKVISDSLRVGGMGFIVDSRKKPISYQDPKTRDKMDKWLATLSGLSLVH